MRQAVISPINRYEVIVLLNANLLYVWQRTFVSVPWSASRQTPTYISRAFGSSRRSGEPCTRRAAINKVHSATTTLAYQSQVLSGYHKLGVCYSCRQP